MAQKIVSPIEKLAFITGVSKQDAELILTGKKRFSVTQLTGLGLDKQKTESAVTMPQILLDTRLDPNQLRDNQIRNLPRIDAERVPIVAQGMPYFSIEEFEAASLLPRLVLQEILSFREYTQVDKTTGRIAKLIPEKGIYISPSVDQFEELGGNALHGFHATKMGEATNGCTLFRLDGFENIVSKPHLLKKDCNKKVLPGIRDADGLTRYFVPLRVDVWFHYKVTTERAIEILKEFGLTPLRAFSPALAQTGFYPARMDADWSGDPLASMLDTINRIQELEEVAFAEPDEFGLSDFPPDIRSVGQLDENFENVGKYWNCDLLGVANAHQQMKSTGAPKVTIFVIDSGLRLDHPDLQSSLRNDWMDHDLNYVMDDPEQETSPAATGIAHGTSVASVVVAKGEMNGVEGSARGIAPGCRIIPIKISGALAPSGYGFRAAAIRQALALVPADQRAVINLSWGMSGDHIGIREALKEADRQDVAVTTSAGNYQPGEQKIANKLHYPSAYSHTGPKLGCLCSIAAFNVTRQLASYSYFGNESVTFASPGGELGGIGSAIYVASLPENYNYVAGTSFAAPHVVGLIALIFSLAPKMSTVDAIQLIKENCDPFQAVNEPNWNQIGAGMINVERTIRALLSAITERPTIDETNPEVSTTIFPLNINIASREELLMIPGMNTWLVDSLISYRNTMGPYTSIWHLVFTGSWDFAIVSVFSPFLTCT